MTRRHVLRERQVWIAVVAALGTATAWLGLLNLVLLATLHSGAWPVVWIVTRALTRAAVLAFQQGVAFLPTALAAGALVALLALALSPRPRGERGVRHA